MMKSRLASWWPALLIVTALCAGGGFLAWSAWVSPGNAFLPGATPAQWIIYPAPAYINLHYDMEVDTVFTRAFSLQAAHPHAILHVRALRVTRVLLNGRPIALEGPTPAWKHEAVADVDLPSGENQIAVTAGNADGPPALWLWLEWPGGGVVSDTSWQSSCAGAAVCPAVLADDPMIGREYDPFHQAPDSLTAWSRAWPRILTFAVLSAALVALGYRLFRRSAAAPERLETTWGRLLLACLVIAVALWSALFIHNLFWLHDGDGFDVGAHRNYIHYVQTHHAIPLADQGWEMYQAPLYYLLAAGLLSSVHLSAGAHAAVIILRGFNLLIGVTNLIFLLACMRLIFLRQPRRQFIGFLVGAFMPMQLYLFQFPTNEILATATATAAGYLCLRILRALSWRLWDCMLLGAGLGLALLAKVSGALLILPVIAALIVHALPPAPSRDSITPQPAGPRGPPGFPRALASILAMLLVAVALAGWYYAKVWAHFGKPLVGNWDPASGLLWWQEPGYRTWASYLRFGRGLTDPLYASFAGVWDGLYSTLWGDAFCGGNRLINSAPWSYDLVVAGIVLGVLPTLAILVGLVAATIQFIRKPTPVWVYLLGLLFAVLLAFIWMTIVVPSYAQPKAFYGLVALVPLCALAGLGLDLLGSWRPWCRGILLAALMTWAFTAFAAYWVNPYDPTVLVSSAAKLDNEGFLEQANVQVRAALQLAPHNFAGRVLLARLLRAHDPDDPEISTLLASAPPAAGADQNARSMDAHDKVIRDALSAARHFQNVYADLRDGQTDRAIADLQMAADLDPDSPTILDVYDTMANLNRNAGHLDRAIACIRQQIRIAPYVPKFHADLARLYAATHQTDLALQQAAYAQHAADAYNAFEEHLAGH